MSGRLVAVALAATLAALACAAPPAADPVDPAEEALRRYGREAYADFVSRHRGVHEPNYLPFMTWSATPASRGIRGWIDELTGRAPAPDRRRILCRWDDGDFPLRTFIEAPVVPGDPELTRPRPPTEYVAAARRALDIWERDLDGRVRFADVASPGEAALTIRLIGEEAPVPDPGVKVLGTTPVGDACRVTGPGAPDGSRLDVRFSIPELRVYIADEFGPLVPDQVEKLVLHEVGHALGMREHSPIPADLMFAVARDRIPRDGLGAEDVNSFLALYDLPNGTVYYDPEREVPLDPRPRLPDGAPELDLAPHVNPSRGFEVQVPIGWMRLTTPYGVVMVNGVPWDSEASLQVSAHRFDTIEEYLGRYGFAHLRNSIVVEDEMGTLDGRRARFTELETSHSTREEFAFVETGDGRVIVVIAESPSDLAAAYHPWFDAVRASLEVSDSDGSEADRSYSR